MSLHDRCGGRAHGVSASCARHRGFTLIELMVVVAIIGILTTLAVVGVRGQSYAGTVQGYAGRVASEVDNARLRAVASGRWQQLQVTPTAVLHWEADSEGMGAPTGYTLVRTLTVPKNVFVRAVDDRTHLAPNDAVPSPDAALDATIAFAPDGSGQAATLFIGNRNDDDHQRVAIFRATGTAYVYKEW